MASTQINPIFISYDQKKKKKAKFYENNTQIIKDVWKPQYLRVDIVTTQ